MELNGKMKIKNRHTELSVSLPLLREKYFARHLCRFVFCYIEGTYWTNNNEEYSLAAIYSQQEIYVRQKGLKGMTKACVGFTTW